jgi:hypothetical protein
MSSYLVKWLFFPCIIGVDGTMVEAFVVLDRCAYSFGFEVVTHLTHIRINLLAQRPRRASVVCDGQGYPLHRFP